MYNALRFRNFTVIVQQARKSLVTSLLAERSYIRGWRCELDYDQYIGFGQVSSKSHRQSIYGERRWSPKRPLANRTLIQNCSAIFGKGTGAFSLLRHFQSAIWLVILRYYYLV